MSDQLDLFTPGTFLDPHASMLGNTIAEGRAYIQEQLDGGNAVGCPCCGGNCAIYRRKLYAQMGAWLIWLVGASRGGEWCSVHDGPTFQGRKGGGDFAKLVHWGLIEQQPDPKDPRKRCSGMWRPTERGRSFALGISQVPEALFIYQNRVVGESHRMVSIETALGKRFDYRDLSRRWMP